jgi:hypothetical protein
MILRPRLNEMDLQRRKQMFTLLQRQPNPGAYAATAARPPTSWTQTIPSGPTSSTMTRHFIPNSGYNDRAVP